MSKNHVIRLFLLTTAFAIIAGCIPIDVVWMPDSKGYLYVNEQRELVYRDLSAQKDTKITGFDWLNPLSLHVAVSPDGEKIALGRLDQKQGSTDAELTLVMLDRSGKQLWQKTKPWKLQDAPTENKTEGVRIEWVPTKEHGDRLIIETDDSETAICTTDVTQWYQWNDITVPLFIEQLESNTTMALPDGSGFLAASTSKEGLQLVDWSGKMKPFTIDDHVKTNDEISVTFNVRYVAWDGLKFKMATPKRNQFIVIDCEKMNVSLQEIEGMEFLWKYIDENNDSVLYFNPQKLIRFANLPETDSDAQQANDKNESRLTGRPVAVELIDIASGKVTKLVDTAQFCLCIPSPNGERMVITYFTDKDKIQEQTLITIDSEGKIIDQFNRSLEDK